MRQDERAMQLFGLVNALFANDRRTANEDLSIQRYAVIPLSPTAGLISWVPKCDTLHDLIRDFREGRKILLNIECKLMQQMAPNQLYDQLTLMQKLEVHRFNEIDQCLTVDVGLRARSGEHCGRRLGESALASFGNIRSLVGAKEQLHSIACRDEHGGLYLRTRRSPPFQSYVDSK